MQFATLKQLAGLMIVLGFAASPRNLIGSDCPCGTAATAETSPHAFQRFPGAHALRDGVVNDGHGAWQPGGYEARVGSPYYYSAQGYGVQGDGVQGANPYARHFGPGFYRSHEYGHYRFPYYSYRRPWYYPGQPVYNRDTNLPW